jgi:hypothetical protein
MAKTNFETYWKSLKQEEQDYYLKLVDTLQKMRDLRESPYKEFNNLSYTERYELNRETALAFNDLKDFSGANAEDTMTKVVSMTTGIPRNKVTAELSHLLQFNFEADIKGYDKNNQIIEHLGENMEHLILKSREIEGWDEKKIDMYRELLEQGNVFIMETYAKIAKTIHDNGSWEVGMKIKDYVKDANAITKFETKAESELILGRNVYLSSLTQRNIQKQDIVAVYKPMSMAMAEKRFGEWDRWEYVEVTKGLSHSDDISKIIHQDTGAGNSSLYVFGANSFWSIRKPTDEVGVLYVFDNANKVYQIIINGIIMLPIGYSLYEISPAGLLPIAKGDAEINTGFTYSKGVIDNTFADSKMADAVYQSMIQKMLQSAKPTMANRSGKILPKGLLYSSRLISGLRAGQFEPLLPTESRTITNSDATFLQIVKSVIGDKTVDDTFAGQNVDTKTATEYLQRQKNTIMKLYSLVLGLQNLEEQLARLRIYSILSKWTQPEEDMVFDDIKEVVDGVWKTVGKAEQPRVVKNYREVLVENKIKRDGSKKGFVYIKFHGEEDELPEPDEDGNCWDILDLESMMTKKMGKQVRLEYLNADRLADLFDYIWKIDIIAKKDDDSRMEVMSFIDILTKVTNLFPDAPNRENVLREVGTKLNQDPEKIFNLEPQQVEQSQMAQQQQAPVIPNPMNKTNRNQMTMM